MAVNFLANSADGWLSQKSNVSVLVKGMCRRGTIMSLPTALPIIPKYTIQMNLIMLLFE
jgi:hypothetical protein